VTDAPPPGPFPPGAYPPPGPAGAYPPPKAGGRRVGVIVAVVAVVLVILCVCCVSAAVYLGGWTSWGDLTGNDPEPARPAPPASPAALDCGVAARPGGKAVGQPDFAAAPRTGLATMTIVTNRGELAINMDRAKTPCTVASFEHLAAKKFFDGTSCHRLVNEGIFVLQCGDPVGDGTGSPDYQFADEIPPGTVEYKRGVVAMANAGPDANGSQFFIVFDTSPLPPDYTVFGEVRTGMDLVDRVAAGGHDNAYASQAGGGRPKTALTFQTVTVS
jgi:peptidyl-prolyl cis-trans isomerase B (cyclophilin B)